MKKQSVEIVVPAYNEGPQLEKNILLIYNFLNEKKLDFHWKITIAENGSKDNTQEIAKKVEKKYKKVLARHFDRASKDNAVIESWLKSDADILIFTDADNSAHPKHIPSLVDAIQAGYDIAAGSRFHKNSNNSRGLYRDFISTIYNRIILQTILPTGVRDAQCGFKAVKREAAKAICPKMQRENGFFDTEFLAVAKHKGFKIAEVPVTWQETRKSVLSVNKNIPNFLKNVFKIRSKISHGYYDDG